MGTDPFRDQVSFFGSAAAAAAWLAAHPGGLVLPIAQGHQLARVLIEDVLS